MSKVAEATTGASLLDLHLDDVPDPMVVPAGEYQIRIGTAELAPSKSSDRTVLKAVCSVLGEEGAKPVFINHAFPLKEDDKGKTYNMKTQIKNFCRAFGVSFDSEPVDWKGAEAFVILDEQEDQNGNPINTVRRYLIKA